ncbi:MAG TPA: LuxR C-terminal-related transcriptional regulator, partial [Ktedonobacteraceae bacterium]|nr:LuxR C-terminal-related transcriptional regulator [Ktedonobacteraceae bacterium]
LAALALQGHKDPGRFIAEFAGSHRYVLDYLTEEVLQQQPAELQEFLLQTSILERLHAPLCNALTGRTDSGAILERLERAHLFVLPLDEQRDWYRYHQLFREFLDRQLQQTRPEQVYSLHVRAANWYEEQGLKVEAIQTWLKIHAYDRAIELIESLGGGLLMSGKVMMLQNWLNRLPEKMLECYPHVALYYCGCFVSLGLFEAAETSLKNAERWHRALQLHDDRRTPEKIQEFEIDLLANRTVLAGFRGNVLETIDLAHKALREVPEDNYLVRGIIRIALGEAYGLKGDLGAALRAFEESRSLQFMLAHTVISLSIQAKLLVSRGNLRAAYKLLLQVQALEQDAPIQIFPTNSMFLTALGELWYEWNDLVAAKNYLLKGVQLGVQWGNPVMQISTMLDLAFVSLSQPARSLELIQEVKLLLAAKPIPGLSRWLEATCAQLRLRLGEKEEAYRWSQTLPEISREQCGYWEESARVIQARILLVQQRFHESLALLEELFPAALERSHLSNSLKISLLRALNLCALGEPEPAFAALEQALEIGEPEGYIRSFVDEGPTLLPLLRQSLKRSKQRAYIQRLLAACEAAYEPESLLTLSRNVFPLSEREKHVIRLLADGKSNQQIADEFMVAVSTVKTHINNIYTKLGVHSRTQALVRARELLLLP